MGSWTWIISSFDWNTVDLGLKNKAEARWIWPDGSYI